MGSHRFAIWTGALLLLGIAFLSAGFWIYGKLQDLRDLESVEALIDEDFPDVEHIEGATLVEWREDPDIDVLVVDCRKEREFAISHLPGAENLTSAREVSDFLEESGREPDHIVVYCSVGWRSSKLARALEKQGVEKVANLRGAIFRWANENRPLEDGEGNPTEKVHPYHSFWGGLLEPGRAATE